MSKENYTDKRNKLMRLANQPEKSAQEELDDFEREALEGLTLLEKKDGHVFTEIDQRIDKVLTENKSRKKTFWYWSIAASIVLVIGLTFVFKNSLNDGEKQEQITLAENLIRKDTARSFEPTTSTEQNTTKTENKIVIREKVNEDLELQSDEIVRERKLKEESLADVNVQESVGAVSNDNVKASSIVKSESLNENKNEPGIASASMAHSGVSSVPELQEAEGRKNLSDKKSAALKENEKFKNSDGDLVKPEDFVTADSTLGEVQILVGSSTNPTYPGGNLALTSFFKNNFKVQDMSLLKGNTLQISVYVNEKGKVSKYKILQSIPNCTDCSKEAIRVCGLLPDWIPGTDNGKSQGKRVTFSIAF